MDLSFWQNQNPNLIVEQTKKQFYQKYLWRLELEVPGGRVLSSPLSVSAEIARLKRTHLHWGHSHTQYYGHRRVDPDTIDRALLQRLKDIKETFKEGTRVRVEEPTVQIYSIDEDTLKTIAVSLYGYDLIRGISGILDPATVPHLRQGAILKNKAAGYQYKVMLRDGAYSDETKAHVLGYLQGLGDQIKISPATRNMLESTRGYLWGCFFYTNDPSITTFLRLIYPSLILSIHELVCLEE